MGGMRGAKGLEGASARGVGGVLPEKQETRGKPFGRADHAAPPHPPEAAPDTQPRQAAGQLSPAVGHPFTTATKGTKGRKKIKRKRRNRYKKTV